MVKGVQELTIELNAAVDLLDLVFESISSEGVRGTNSLYGVLQYLRDIEKRFNDVLLCEGQSNG